MSACVGMTRRRTATPMRKDSPVCRTPQTETMMMSTGAKRRKWMSEPMRWKLCGVGVQKGRNTGEKEWVSGNWGERGGSWGSEEENKTHRSTSVVAMDKISPGVILWWYSSASPSSSSPSSSSPSPSPSCDESSSSPSPCPSSSTCPPGFGRPFLLAPRGTASSPASAKAARGIRSTLRKMAASVAVRIQRPMRQPINCTWRGFRNVSGVVALCQSPSHTSVSLHHLLLTWCSAKKLTSPVAAMTPA